MEYRFIGGEYDGERIDLGDNTCDLIQMPSKSLNAVAPVNDYGVAIPPHEARELIVYYRMRYTISNKRVVFYLHSELYNSDTDFMYEFFKQTGRV